MSNSELSRAATRQTLTATTFVEIVDTLVGDFDVIEVLTALTSRCVELLDAAAAGILLADPDGHLRVIGASTEQIALLELFQIQNDQGPCLDCFHSGQVVHSSALAGPTKWPQFAAESVTAGFPSVCAIPLRLKSVILGCLNLFMSEPIGLSDGDIELAQALADVASIAIIQDQATRNAAIREGHLQHALISRIAIEQAKGMIAERAGVDMDEAFSRLRARAEQQPGVDRGRRGARRRRAADRRLRRRPSSAAPAPSSDPPRLTVGAGPDRPPPKAGKVRRRWSRTACCVAPNPGCARRPEVPTCRSITQSRRWTVIYCRAGSRSPGAAESST